MLIQRPLQEGLWAGIGIKAVGQGLLKKGVEVEWSSGKCRKPLFSLQNIGCLLCLTKIPPLWVTVEVVGRV